MRVRIAKSFVVSDRMRRAIRFHFGKPGLATREEVKHWYEDAMDSLDEDALYDLEQEEERPERLEPNAEEEK